MASKIAVVYRIAPRGRPAIATIADQARRDPDARIGVALAIVDEASTRGCCGVSRPAWRSMVEADMATEHMAFVAALRESGCRVEAERVIRGSSLDVVARTAADLFCADRVVQLRRRGGWRWMGLQPGARARQYELIDLLGAAN